MLKFQLWILKSEGWRENHLRYYDGYIPYMLFIILTTVNVRLNAKVNILRTIFGENRWFVTYQSIKLEKLLEAEDFMRITNHFRGIYSIHLKWMKTKLEDVNI